MTETVEILMMICLIALAFFAVQTPKLRRAVVYLGAFSLLCSFVFLLYNAPDVAIAEAVIGCTLSTILFLIAIKKRHVLTVYYVEDDAEEAIKKERRELTNKLERHLISMELEPQIITTHLEDEEISEKCAFDILIVGEKNDICIYSSGLKFITPEIRLFVLEHKPRNLNVIFCTNDECVKEGTQYE